MTTTDSVEQLLRATLAMARAELGASYVRRQVQVFAEPFNNDLLRADPSRGRVLLQTLGTLQVSDDAMFRSLRGRTTLRLALAPSLAVQNQAAYVWLEEPTEDAGSWRTTRRR